MVDTVHVLKYCSSYSSCVPGYVHVPVYLYHDPIIPLFVIFYFNNQHQCLNDFIFLTKYVHVTGNSYHSHIPLVLHDNHFNQYHHLAVYLCDGYQIKMSISL